jgi:hypothetical protein
MLRLSAAQVAAILVLLAGMCALPASGAAQDWDDARTISLVERAT